jgi:hypothetical protein
LGIPQIDRLVNLLIKNKEKIVTAFFVLIVVGALLDFFFSRVSDEAPGKEKVEEAIQEIKKVILRPVAGGVCESVVRHCDLEVIEDSEDCNKKALRKKVEQSLARPTENEQCVAVKAELAGLCEKGCPLDYDSMFVIPGQIQFDELPLLPEDGEAMPADITQLKGCRLRGRRSVVYRGECSK